MFLLQREPIHTSSSVLLPSFKFIRLIGAAYSVHSFHVIPLISVSLRYSFLLPFYSCLVLRTVYVRKHAQCIMHNDCTFTINKA